MSKTIWYVDPDMLRNTISESVEEKVIKRLESFENRIAEIEKRIMRSKKKMDSRIFGEEIRKGLERAGMTMAELSRRTGIGKSSITEYCNGSVLPSPKYRKAIRDVLGIPEETARQEKTANKAMPRTDHSDAMSISEAAAYLGKSDMFVRIGLREGILNFGYAVEMPSGQYSYWIGRDLFFEKTRLKERTN